MLLGRDEPIVDLSVDAERAVVALARLDSRLLALVLVGHGDDHRALREAHGVDSVVGDRARLADDVAQVLIVDLVVGSGLSKRLNAGLDVLDQGRLLLEPVRTVLRLLEVVHRLEVRRRQAPLRLEGGRVPRRAASSNGDVR